MRDHNPDMVGLRVVSLGRKDPDAPRKHEAGRTCDVPECITILSQYNPSLYCYAHDNLDTDLVWRTTKGGNIKMTRNSPYANNGRVRKPISGEQILKKINRFRYSKNYRRDMEILDLFYIAHFPQVEIATLYGLSYGRVTQIVRDEVRMRALGHWTSEEEDKIERKRAGQIENAKARMTVPPSVTTTGSTGEAKITMVAS